MPRVPRGLKIKDVVIGEGEEATRRHTVVALVRIFLNRGTEVTTSESPRTRIDLFKRDCIAGVRYGIEGMRVGGRRELVISPHLAYGTAGCLSGTGEWFIPPNAVLRCEVELLEVREPGAWTPDDRQPGRQLSVDRSGEAAYSLPRWQFGLNEDGECSLSITQPVAGAITGEDGTGSNLWRHARHRGFRARWDPETTANLLEAAFTIPVGFPQECLEPDELWSDMAERGNGITRDRKTNSRCVTILVSERGQDLSHYAVPETSQAWLTSPLCAAITRLLGEHPDDQ